MNSVFITGMLLLSLGICLALAFALIFASNGDGELGNIFFVGWFVLKIIYALITVYFAFAIASAGHILTAFIAIIVVISLFFNIKIKVSSLGIFAFLLLLGWIWQSLPYLILIFLI